MDASTAQAIAELQEIADRLLESCGPIDDPAPDFYGEGGKGLPGFIERMRIRLAQAQEYARRCKANFEAHLEQFKLIRRAQFLLSKLVAIDVHALVARIRRVFSHLACIRVPLFEYGPELSDYRHRFRLEKTHQ
ncbi:hypothetical protein [Pseudomonas sp. 25571]|uniref:hypothetical protein n=1 Tax=Pseudomonas sp. 25571 TaxID=2967216 RepID=UPI002364151A|nr:hypothetical protein [Pseudomonas sp. 25571]MDD2064484.1 hypothetical protein [Pseudomonas sp. 25571]